MKVETVIRDTQWFAGSERSQPDVSVLLYVHGADTRRLARSVESVLAQTLDAVELVVVDDSGAADVAHWLDAARARDPRIAVLRHAQPIGISAVGWIEALTHSRAPRFVIARSGDVFDAGALDALLAYAQGGAGAIPFGYVETLANAELDGAGATYSSSSAGGHSMAVLRTCNFIARHAVLIPRAAVEAIGFVDPHVMLSDAAEWDFWRRLSGRFELRAVDVAVGAADAAPSAGAAHGWALEEWMRTPRNELLLLDHIGDYDIVAPNPTHGPDTRGVCEDLALDFMCKRFGGGSVPAADEGRILIVTAQYDASIALYFDMLPEPWRHRVRVVIHGHNPDFGALAGASVLVLSRAIRSYRPWIDTARKLGVPLYYFIDDNMSVLVESGEAHAGSEDFSAEAMRKDLGQFDGVLLSSRQLAEYFRERDLHPRLLYFPVVCADLEQRRAQLASGRNERNGDELVFAFMGGTHRSQAVWDLILPALAQIAAEGHRIHFVGPDTGSDGMFDDLPPSMRVTLLPWDPGYEFALRRFASLSPDYVLLAPGRTANNRYKTLHPLLTAALVDAVAVLPRTDPYAHIEDGSVALMVDQPFEQGGWYAVLRRIVDARVDVAGIRRSNDAFCAREFSGSANVVALSGIVSAADGVPSWPRQVCRLDAMMHDAKMGGGGARKAGSSAGSLEELHALRHMRRYSWRHRVLSRPSDIWEYCSPAFSALKRDTGKYGWRRRGSTLEFSDSLHMLPHRDYDVVLPAGMLGGLAFAFASDGPGTGQAIVELISPTGERVASAERNLARADLSRPLRFVFDPVRIEASAVWRVRLRCTAAVPVYVYEIINRRGLGMFYGPPSPFMEILPPDPIRKSRSPAAQQSSSGGVAQIDLKFVVEGDIPTNQIIQRLVTEALGAGSEVTRLLLPQFTPEAVTEGALIILSRTASPASLPMLDWMRAHGVPFVYYIDDNFWELKGDSPIAQFYQSASVRKTLERSVEEARHVIVNAPRLGDYIKERHPLSRITQLNAPFDFSLIDDLPAPVKPIGEVRVGFAGSITRADDFVEILPALERVLETFAHVMLVFFGYCPPELVGRERVTFVPHVASYPDFIRMKASYGLDVGLAPMADLAANLYKTNNKYREYGAMRIAGIYTNTSPYTESVTDGVTGMLVEHDAEAWYRALEKLITDEPLRKQIADAAHADVRAHYAQDVVAQQWREFLLKFAQESRAAGVAAKKGYAGEAYIRARRWLGHAHIRASVLRARARAKMVRAAKRFSGERSR